MKQRTDTEIGKVVRRIRQNKEMTVTELAEATGMSASYISQMERGLISPSVTALHQLSEALGVPTFYFFVEEDLMEIVVRAQDRKVMAMDSAARYELVSPTLRRNMQLVQCILAVGESTRQEPFPHKGEEAAYIVQGRVELSVGEHLYTLEQGDCAQFEARLPHKYRNIGAEEAVILFSISPPM